MYHSTATAPTPRPAAFDALQRTRAACGEKRSILEVTAIDRVFDGAPTVLVCRACVHCAHYLARVDLLADELARIQRDWCGACLERAITPCRLEDIIASGVARLATEVSAEPVTA